MNSTLNSGMESVLLGRAQEGDFVAFERLIAAHRGQMRAVALRSLRNVDDADDAVQDAVVKAFRALKGFDRSRSFAPWLLRICSNCCVDLLRQRRANEPLESVEYGLRSETCIERQVANEAAAERVWESIQHLPRHYREIVTMRHYAEMEVHEIAARTSRPEGTVKSWLFRARALLRKDLGAHASGAA